MTKQETLALSRTCAQIVTKNDYASENARSKPFCGLSDRKRCQGFRKPLARNRASRHGTTREHLIMTRRNEDDEKTKHPWRCQGHALRS